MSIDQHPKAELHCHLDGLFCPAYIAHLQAKGFCSGLDLQKLKQLYPVESIQDWFHLRDFLAPFISRNGDLFLEVIKLHLSNLGKQNVKYAEIMLDSLLVFPDNLLSQVLMNFKSAAAELEGIEVRYLYALARSNNREKFVNRIERVLSLWKRGFIHGFALAGDESICKVRDYADVFNALAEEGMPVEIHAGEWCGVDSIWDALEYGHPRRIGHGLCLFDDPALPKYLKENGIHVEFCPTSNMKVGGISRIEYHPIFKAIDYGLDLSVNTDDPGHFECTMNSEFELINSVRPLTESIQNRIFTKSLKAAFGDDTSWITKQVVAPWTAPR